MSSSKKAQSASENSKSSTSSKSDAIASSPVVSKRPLEEEEPSDGPEDWGDVLRRVFVTRDAGAVREFNGKRNFTIIGYFADDKVIALQMWGKHADRVSRFFSKAVSDSADGEVVWIMPREKTEGWSFRLSVEKSGSFLRNAHGADYLYSFHCPDNIEFPKDVFPQLYVWTSEPYLLNKGSSNERKVPHFVLWGKSALLEEDDIPTTCTFQQDSPKKAARVQGGTRHAVTALSFDD